MSLRLAIANENVYYEVGRANDQRSAS
jgi:hypothetical protein